MKCVLMSIQAEHSYNIFSGMKDDEVRKRPPKLVPPFKVYVYQSRGSTKGKPVVFSKGKIHDLPHGVVVGEFICDRVLTVRSKRAAMLKHPRLRTCITMDQLLQYMGRSDEVSFLHIKDRDVYDKPLPLSMFRRCAPKIGWDNGAPEITYQLDRPPQSWCYVEELGDD